MRAPAILLVAGLVAMAEGGLRAKPRTLQRQQKQTLLAAGAATQDCGNQLLSCTDCSTVLQCTRLGTFYRPVRTTQCPVDTPYCSAGVCVASLPDESCVSAPSASNSFVCNGDGYFPDPGDCHQYWMCVDGKAYQYSCSNYANTVYSQQAAMCVPSSEAACTTVTCSNALVGVYQRYAADPEVYAVCRDAVAANALVAACPPNFTVDTATGDCELTCLAEGRLADRENNTRYYECIQTGTNTYTKPVLLMCPPGSTFSADRQRCLTGHEDNADSGDSGDKAYEEEYFAPDASVPESQYDIPEGFLIGAASAAYQVEGAWNESDKSLSICDVFLHSQPGAPNGDVADNSYHQYMEDVAMLTELKMQFYRFSISWPRLLPQGDSAHPSATGLAYYNNLINALVDAGIEPVVTLYHWDLPQVIQEGGGWLSADIQEKFVDYATYCFQNFGDRVKTWIIMNEPHSVCYYGYEAGQLAPGLVLPGTGAYQCSHNMVLAHAKTYRAYQENYAFQGGQLGSAISFVYPEPASSRQEDLDAAERFKLFRYGWFADPLYFGDYPAEMRRIVDGLSAAEGRSTSRLPSFTDEEKTLLKGAMDFLGLNLYAATIASARTSDETLPPGYDNDAQVDYSNDPNWIQSSRTDFPVTPFALPHAANWIKNRYNNFPVWVSENGYAGAGDEGTHDQKRIGFHSGYMRGLMQAINRDKCNVIAYTVWSIIDNYEWGVGYDTRFGMTYVDINDPALPRSLKDSSQFFLDTLATRHVSYVKAT